MSQRGPSSQLRERHLVALLAGSFAFCAICIALYGGIAPRKLLWAAWATTAATPYIISLASGESADSEPLVVEMVRVIVIVALVVAAHRAMSPVTRPVIVVGFLLITCSLAVKVVFLSSDASSQLRSVYLLAYPLFVVPGLALARRVGERGWISLVSWVVLIAASFVVAQQAGVFGGNYAEGTDALIRIGSWEFYRATGALGNPNNLGLLGAMGIAMLVGRGERVASAGRAAAILMLVTSVSLGAAVALAAALISARLKYRPSRRSSRRLLAAAVATAGLLAIFLSTRSAGRNERGVLASLVARFDNWATAVDLWSASPRSLMLGVDGALLPSIDNQYLQLLVEYGAVGTVGFLLLVIGFADFTQRTGYFAYASRAAVIVIATYGLVGKSLAFYPAAPLMWMAVGASSTAKRGGRTTSGIPRSDDGVRKQELSGFGRPAHGSAR